MNKKEPQIQITRSHVEDSIRIQILDFIRYSNEARMEV